MTAKVENYCLHHSFRVKTININGNERACVNCIWYEPYCRRNRGNVATWVPTHIGFCLRREKQCGALRQPCKDFETETR